MSLSETREGSGAGSIRVALSLVVPELVNKSMNSNQTWTLNKQ